MFRLLHLADLHLGWAPGYIDEPRRTERRRRRDNLLHRAVEFALNPANHISIVVIVGDLFESHHPDSALVGTVIESLRRLERAGILVVTVPGNHDEVTYADSVYRQYAKDWPGVLVQNPLPECVATFSVEDIPVYIYSLAYTGGLTPTQPALAQFPRVAQPGFHFAAFHGTLGNWGNERSLPLDKAALARAGYDYVALGHIHQHQEYNLGGALAVYCGAVEGKGFDDPGVRHWTIVEVDMPFTSSAGRPTIRVLTEPANGVQPIETITLDAGRFTDEAALRKEIENLSHPDWILEVRLTGLPEFEIDIERLCSSLAGYFFHLSIIDETTVFAPGILDRWAAEPTIRGLFVRCMREKIENAPDDNTRRLLQRALRQGLHALARGGGQ